MKRKREPSVPSFYMAGKEFYALLRTSGGISFEYEDFIESDFAAANGAAYTPPEEGDWRRINALRTIQLLSECPVVVETFQTSAANIRLPLSSATPSLDDAGNGRYFIIKNSGTGNITVQDSTGANQRVIEPLTILEVVGNMANNWDFVDANSLFFDNSTNGFAAKRVQPAIEEAKAGPGFGTPVSVGLTNAQGSAATAARSDHIHRVDNLTHSSLSPRLTETTSTLNGTLVLTNTSNFEHALVGTATGFKYQLPNATTLTTGWKFEIWNQTSQAISLTYNDGTTYTTLPASSFAIVTLQSSSTTNGSWMLFKAFTGVASGLLNYTVTSNTPFTTSSRNPTFAVITGMSAVPVPGTYEIKYNASVYYTTTPKAHFWAIYTAGVQENHSLRQQDTAHSNQTMVDATMDIVQYDGVAACDVRVACDNTGSLTVNARTLSLIRLGD